MKGKESWRVGRSISWDLGTLALCEAHRDKLGMERSQYVEAALEHIQGIRPHPELFDPKTNLTPEEITAALALSSKG